MTKNRTVQRNARYDQPDPQSGQPFISADLRRVKAGFVVTMNDRRGRKWTPPTKDRTHSTADRAVAYIKAHHPEVVSVRVTLA